jgi:thiol-disulfide isomerase/thioredoxin
MPKVISWAPSYDAAVRAARAQRKLLLVDFVADWCGYCKKLDQETYPDPQLVDYVRRELVAVRQDTDREGRSLAQKYRITSLPTILLLTSDGQIAGRMAGFRPAPEFLRALKQMVDDERGLPDLARTVAAHPGDTAKVQRLVGAYARRGAYDKAAATVSAMERAAPGGAYAEAFLAIGLMYYNGNRSADALRWFDKGLKTATAPSQRAVGHIGIALCRIARRDAAGARAHLKTVVEMPGALPEQRQQAQTILSRIP